MEPDPGSSDLKDKVERHLCRICTILTTAQRSADWFIMRQLRLTSTNAGLIFISDNAIRTLCLGLDETEKNENCEHLMPTLKVDLATLARQKT